MAGYVSLQDVTKTYKMGEVTIKAADGINFDVEKGEFVIVVGPSGAGKTTVLNILGGMDTATSGKVLVDGQTAPMMGCDLVALEANYDAFSLHGGPYPYYLKVRIASDRGHLDNKACAAEILDLIQDGCKKFALCHLSQTNNSPELVMTTVYNVLLAAGIQPGRDVLIQAQSRSEVSPYIEF